jgi:hypothetical protein
MVIGLRARVRVISPRNKEAAPGLREAVRMVFGEDGIPVQLARSLDLDIA